MYVYSPIGRSLLTIPCRVNGHGLIMSLVVAAKCRGVLLVMMLTLTSRAKPGHWRVGECASNIEGNVADLEYYGSILGVPDLPKQLCDLERGCGRRSCCATIGELHLVSLQVLSFSWSTRLLVFWSSGLLASWSAGLLSWSSDSRPFPEGVSGRRRPGLLTSSTKVGVYACEHVTQAQPLQEVCQSRFRRSTVCLLCPWTRRLPTAWRSRPKTQCMD